MTRKGVARESRGRDVSPKISGLDEEKELRRNIAALRGVGKAVCDDISTVCLASKHFPKAAGPYLTLADAYGLPTVEPCET
jgi:hypothetical protein